MIGAALASIASTNPMVIGALLGGAIIAFLMATRGGRGPRTH